MAGRRLVTAVNGSSKTRTRHPKRRRTVKMMSFRAVVNVVSAIIMISVPHLPSCTNQMFTPDFVVSTEIFLLPNKTVQYRTIIHDGNRGYFSADLASPKMANGEMVEWSEKDIIDMNKNTFYRINLGDPTSCKVLYANNSEVLDMYKYWWGIFDAMFNLNQTNKVQEKVYDGAVDVDTYVNVTRVTKVPETNVNVSHVSDWKILSQSWKDPGAGQSQSRRPIRVSITFEDDPQPQTVDFNNWTPRKPYFKQLSIAKCFESKNSKKIVIRFQRVGTTPLKRLTLADVDKIIQKVADSSGITPLRLTNTTVTQDATSATLTTFLLGHPSEIKGSSVSIDGGRNLKTAFAELVKVAKTGITVDNVAGGVSIKSSEAREWKAPAPPKKPQGPTYGPGDMGGLAVGMLIAGTLIGLCVALLVYSYRNQQNPIEVLRSGIPGR